MVSPSPLGEWSGEGDVPPPQKNFPIFLLKIPYFDAFWRVYFLKHTPMEVVLTRSNPLLGTPLARRRAYLGQRRPLP